MRKRERVITRRDFLRGTAGITLAATIGAGITPEVAAENISRVVLIRNPDVLTKGGEIKPQVIQSMLDEGVKVLLQKEDAIQAWKELFRSSDVVGIKSNVWHYMPTPRELEVAIRQRIIDAGVPERNISVDDRGVLSDPVFLNSTALVNVRPLRTHFWSGIGGCIKNYIMFVKAPMLYHGDACSDLASIWGLPIVKGKTRINILSLIQPQFYGRGPHFFDRRYVWPYRGLLLGTDPVALDAIGAHLLQVKRISFFGEDRPLDVPPKHITVADKKYRLGVSDLSRIRLIKLGWMEESLI